MYTWASFLPSFLPLETRTLEEGKVGGESGGACHYLTPACSQDITARVLGVTLESHCLQGSGWFGSLAAGLTLQAGSRVCTVLSLPRNSQGTHAGAAQAAQLVCPQMTACTVVCYTGG